MRPIRVYLLILVLGAMLPGALLTGILVWRAYASNRDVSERRLLESARVDALALDREFTTTINVLQALAASPALDRDDLQEFSLEARRLQSTQPGWFTVTLSGTDGRLLIDTQQPVGEPLPLPADPDSLQRLIKAPRPTVGTVYDTKSSEPDHHVAIRIPVLRRNTLKYALSAIVTVEALARVLPRQIPNSDEWTRVLLDSEGTIAVRTRGGEGYIGGQANESFRERIKRSTESVSRETTREGVDVYAAFNRSMYGWTAVVVVPRANLDEPLFASMTGVLGGGVVLALCGLLAVLSVSRRLSADLTMATAAAEAVAEGRPVPKASAHVAETQRLQSSLANTASLLERRALERDEEIRRADAARQEAEEANRTKDAFLAALGHELRNPLAPALSALDVMKFRDPRAFVREREVLSRQVAHMARLVDDLLDISRLGQGKLQLRHSRFEVREAVDRALDMARPLLIERNHTLDLQVPPVGLPVLADLDRIVQVLSNLMTNAAKYTPPGGHVAIVASASNDRVLIRCEDNGPGIPDALVPKLFDPFAQGPRALDRREGGLGLGLTLARNLTELHDGTIQYESRGPGNGSRFVVTLPLAGPDVPAVQIEVVRPSRDSEVRRILVVDDNEDARDMLQIVLQDAGHHVAIAGDGPGAIATAAEFRPAVGVLDIGLPGMDGYELARQLRMSYPEMRLIALTGYSQAWDRKAAEAAGFDAHCAKPVVTDVLLNQIEGHDPV